ncbi:TwdlH, partial [Drosophila busckii]
MRAFVLLCLVAFACADKLGYNYQPVGHSGAGDGDATGPTRHSLNFQPSESRFQPSAHIAEPTGQAANYAAPQAELEKEFYTYSANEQDFDEPQALDRVNAAVNKALRVVFIKGPENRGLEDAALALAKQAAQQETAIYVLNKQTDLGELAQKFNAVRNNVNNKPEVHFVKYRTQEDALNAQRAIQGQYDQLGGTSQAHDGGVASALNFASQAPAEVREHASEASAPGPSYLPANIFRRLR